MDSEKWLEIKRIFNEAIELSGKKREKFLSEACCGDVAILSEVEKLIIADAGSRTFSNVFSNLDAENSLLDKTIGNYKIIREIGRGGMGAVFLAAREDFEKKVALKIVKHELSSTELKRRFQNERKILAALEHPNIARLLDGGATEKGLPYFVMEYVEGEDFLTYCETNNLTVAERLKIFRKVCAAVSYAHGKLIVHRDLKPSNILVGRDGEPKLLDFGISKLLDGDSLEQPGTATALGMMTPNYASPEQIRGESVSTATDTYSLGVILYELLTNALPYNVTNRRLDEVARAICETEPERPSSVVSGRWRGALIGKETNQNEGRKTKDKGQKTNSAALRGDLDNIILKALRKEPERRYTSVEKFSDDLRRHLEGLPVTARPDTFSYRAEKFIRRNAMAVAAVLLIVLSLLGGVAATTYQSVRAERERKLAEKRFNQVRELANNVVFKYHDAIANLQGSTEVRQLLVKDATTYLDTLSQDANNDMKLQQELALAYAKLADVQGKVFYANVGDTAGAIESYRKAIALLENVAKNGDSEMKAGAEDSLAEIYHYYSAINSRTANFDEAVSAQQKALSLAEAKFKAQPDDIKIRLNYIRHNGWLGDVYSESGRFNEAMELYRGAIEKAEAAYQAAPDNDGAMTILGVYHDRVGRNFVLRGQELARTDFPSDALTKLFTENTAHLEKTLELFAKVADKHPNDQKYQRNLNVAKSNLGMALRNVGELDKSLEFLGKDIAEREKEITQDNANSQLKADLVFSLQEYALTLTAKNETAKAIEVQQRGIAILDKLVAEDPANTEYRQNRFRVAMDYGDTLVKSGDVKGALKIYEDAYEQLKKGGISDDNPFFDYAEGFVSDNVGTCYGKLADNEKSTASRRADLEKAQVSFQKAVEVWQRPKVRQTYLSRTPEMFQFLERKLENCNVKLTSL